VETKYIMNLDLDSEKANLVYDEGEINLDLIGMAPYKLFLASIPYCTATMMFVMLQENGIWEPKVKIESTFITDESEIKRLKSISMRIIISNSPKEIVENAFLELKKKCAILNSLSSLIDLSLEVR
jgi:uncharacterized OsmC-like protein